MAALVFLALLLTIFTASCFAAHVLKIVVAQRP